MLRLLPPQTYRSSPHGKEKGCDYVATTLSISPLKNAEKLNEIGEELAEQYGVRWLPNDFKNVTATNVPQNCPKSTICTVRTIVDASSPIGSVTRKHRLRFYTLSGWKNLQPISVRILDKIDSHSRIFKADTAHLFMVGVCCLIIIHAGMPDGIHSHPDHMVCPYLSSRSAPVQNHSRHF